MTSRRTRPILNSLLVCGHSSLEKPTIQGEMTPRGPVAIWLTHDAGKTWITEPVACHFRDVLLD